MGISGMGFNIGGSGKDYSAMDIQRWVDQLAMGAQRWVDQ